MDMKTNPTGLMGIEFVEFASQDPESLHQLFLDFGFSRVMRHRDKAIDLYKQNDIHFLLNYEARTFAEDFAGHHGPCISSMGWRTALNPHAALENAMNRGALAANGDYRIEGGRLVPAIYGIGESLIYFVDSERTNLYERLGFLRLENPDMVAPKGFTVIDHLTNNVAKGTMERWAGFYKEVFGFTEVRYFDIRGAQTGLTSYALRSPCGTFCIPINEADEAKSQINEYLDEYNGPGIQHLAFLTDNILASIDGLRDSKRISFLDIEDNYYGEVFGRVPNVKEDHNAIQEHNVLVDGDEHGYLLQIFTKNIVGPIFIELIQRENHTSFGEGNFGALFRSIERDQIKRGVLTA